MAFFDQFIECKLCSRSDPTQDTVKVNLIQVGNAPDAKQMVDPFATTSADSDCSTGTADVSSATENANVPDSKQTVDLFATFFLDADRSTVIANESSEIFKKVPEDEEESLHQVSLDAQEDEEERWRAEVEAAKDQKKDAETEAEEAFRQQKEIETLSRRHVVEEQAAYFVHLQEAAEAADNTEAEEAAEAARNEAKELDNFSRLALAPEKEFEERACGEDEDQILVSMWCIQNGFADVNSRKKKLFGGWKFPLHTAVKRKDLRMVKALITCGADKSAKDSKSQTALDLASKSDRGKGSMAEFLSVLA